MNDFAVRRFRAGETLLAPGAAGGGAWLLLSGRVQLSGPGSDADDLLGPGDLVGEVGMLTGRPHRVGAVAVEPVEVCAVTRDTLGAAFAWLQGRTGAPAAMARAWRRLLLVPEDGRSKARFRELEIVALPFRVGRVLGRHEGPPSVSIDLALPDEKPYEISRVHFSIEETPDGPVVRDGSSHLGTEVNGLRIGNTSPRDTAPLRAGENLIVAGRAASRFRMLLTVEP
ncbi:MAG: cyclic nucleotide-binding domain-containing protein [Alphaproteobacteria bacterium]